LLFVAAVHADRIRETYLDGPADLVVEIVSPESMIRDRREKFLEYQAAKIPEYWLLDQPRREALFYVLDADGRYQLSPVGEDGIYTSTMLPGFRLRVEWLWRSPLPTLSEALADLLG
jgi:Uma2 family endonuclease